MTKRYFKRRPEIDKFELKHTPFKETPRVRNFDSGSVDLDDFLNTKEVERYEKEGYGKTTLVYYKGELVAYYTISTEGLRVEYLKDWRSITRAREMGLDSIPCIKIGRLAVQKDWQSKGIGRGIITYIAGMALEQLSNIGVRLMIVESKKGSREFYTKCGFVLVYETKRERKKEHRTMFFDLRAIEHIQDV